MLQIYACKSNKNLNIERIKSFLELGEILYVFLQVTDYLIQLAMFSSSVS